MKLFSAFRRKPESPAEKQALANLDEATREVVRTPAGDRSLRDVLHEHDDSA